MKSKLRNEDRFAVTIEWCDKDKGFVARVPDLPGCICIMDTEAQAMREIRLLIRTFLEIREEREAAKLCAVA